jgi:hypothetical protein
MTFLSSNAFRRFASFAFGPRLEQMKGVSCTRSKSSALTRLRVPVADDMDRSEVGGAEEICPRDTGNTGVRRTCGMRIGPLPTLRNVIATHMESKNNDGRRGLRTPIVGVQSNNTEVPSSGFSLMGSNAMGFVLQ